MTPFKPPLDDITFILEEIGGRAEIAGLPGFEEIGSDLVSSVLEEAGRLARDVVAPLNATGDREGAVLENGVVRTPPGFADAFARFAQGGWMSLPFPAAHGGQDLPWLVNTALHDLMNGANMAFMICPLLTQGAIEALLHHGTEAQKRIYADKLIAGRWTGAMCLTEPQAGTDLASIRTEAVRDGEHYRIRGQKIYISFGDHDMTENVVHLVLARLRGAPPGTRGISLFIVPKFIPDADGNPGQRNDMRVLKLEHKLGIHGSPTCHIVYGDDEGAKAFLVGEENAGMRCMFTMMNNARLAVGHEGIGLAEGAYQHALAYAKERIQGRWQGEAAPLLAYPDVRRSLLVMRTRILAMRALAYWTAGHVDRAQRSPDPAVREASADRVALMTPLVKAWCTDLAQTITSDAVQLHGGMGFVEETGIAQFYRDAKILSIYEGTNGIQALDLVNRKLGLKDGAAVEALFRELRGDLARLETESAATAAALAPALASLETASAHLARAGDADRAAGATPFLRLFATVCAGFALARGLAPARRSERRIARGWPAFVEVYCRHILPETRALEPAIMTSDADLNKDLLVA